MLAAGSSQRFGSDKRRAPLASGQSLLQASVERALGAFGQLTLVLREGDDPVALGVPDCVDVLFNPHSAQGMASSLVLGVQHLQQGGGEVFTYADVTNILIENGLVKDVAGLYRLDKDELLKLDRMGDKLATKKMTNIEVSKQRPLHRVLFALGIIHVGSEIAELLTQRYASLNEMAEATAEELTEIPGIGPKIAESVVDYFAVPLNQQVLKALGDAGVVLHHDIQDVQEAAFD